MGCGVGDPPFKKKKKKKKNKVFLTIRFRGEGLLLVEQMSHDPYLGYLGRDVLLDHKF
jgi:hypothetical protein